jgi:hypothetical protein
MPLVTVIPARFASQCSIVRLRHDDDHVREWQVKGASAFDLAYLAWLVGHGAEQAPIVCLTPLGALVADSIRGLGYSSVTNA